MRTAILVATLTGRSGGARVRHRLQNGLTVLVEENHAAPVSALQVWVRVGSADELSDEAGLAHLHEHMLFKGTARRGPGEIARTIEAAGGEINAWTSFDQTVYHVIVASQFTAQGLDVLADAITQAAFDPQELERLIEVVCEEIKRSLDSPARKLSKELFANAYTRHPYGKPVIGTEESVRSFTREGILRFYRRWYRPENCVVVAVGDVREQEILDLAQRHFAWPGGGFERGPERQTEPPRSRPHGRVVREKLKEGYLSIAWPAPALRDPDVAALDALAIVLGHGDGSRLFRALKRDRLLCTQVQASCYTPVDPGLTIVGLTLKPEQVQDAVREALRQVYATRAAEVTDEELSLACRLIESEAVYQRETVQGQARKLGFYESSASGIEFEAEYLAKVAALTPRIVREAAERHIHPEVPVACAILPEGDGIDSDALSALLAEAQEAAHKAPRAPTSPRPPEKREPIRFAEPRTGPLFHERLPGGGVLLVKEERAAPPAARRAGSAPRRATGGVAWRSTRRERVGLGRQHAPRPPRREGDAPPRRGRAGPRVRGDGRVGGRQFRPQLVRDPGRVPLPASRPRIRAARRMHRGTRVRAARGGARAQAAARRIAGPRGQPRRGRLPALLRDALSKAPLPIRRARDRGLPLAARPGTAFRLPGKTIPGGERRSLHRGRRRSGRG